MNDQSTQLVIGKVLRASTVGFVCGTRSQEIQYPSLGAFVAASCTDETQVIGLIFAISIDDDPLVRQIILANNMSTAAQRDQRENRMVPVEIAVVNVGFIERGIVYHSLPPRPPLSLDAVQLCDDQTILQFTERLDFLRLVLNMKDVPTEELLAAALKHAARCRPREDRYQFMVEAGRRLAGLLAHDLPRLQHCLKLIKPAEVGVRH